MNDESFSNIEDFFKELEPLINSFYIINNDLFFNQHKTETSSDSIFFMIFLKDNYKWIEKNSCVYIKTDYKNSKFEFIRIGILNDFSETYLSQNGYKNYSSAYKLFLTTGKNNLNTNLNSSLINTILFDSHKDSNIFKSNLSSQNGKIKLDKSWSFYKDYIVTQRKKYDKSNLNSIFPIVLKIEENATSKLNFLARIEENNPEFVDVVNNMKNELFFYNIEDSDEKIVLKRNIAKFEEFNLVGELKHRIELISSQIKLNEIQIKENEVSYLNQNEQVLIKNLENKVKNYQTKYSNLSQEIEKNEQLLKQHQDKKNINNKENNEYDIESLKNEISDLKNKKREIKSELDDCVAQHDAKNQGYKFWKSKNDNLKNKNVQNLKIIDKYQNTIEKQQNKYKYYKFNLRDNELGKLNINQITTINLDEIEHSENYLIKIFKDNNNFIISDEDYGTYAKHKRFYNSLCNFRSGQYKNPLLAKSIEDPEFFKIDEQTLTDYKLNMPPSIKLNLKQKEAVKKAILSPCLSYLQGPPGTGKTQTASALIYHIINNKRKNVLLMSSTHEAILNAFDRVAEITQDNPNFIFYKTIREKNDKLENLDKKNNVATNTFDLDYAFYNFSLSAINYNLKRNEKDNLNIILGQLKIINGVSLNENIESNKRIINFLNILNSNDDLSEKISNLSQYKYDFNSLFKNLEIEYSYEDISDIKYCFEDLFEEINRRRGKEEKYISELSNLILKNFRLKQTYEFIQQNDINVVGVFKNKENIEEISAKIIHKLKIIQTKIKAKTNNNNKEIEESFSKYVFENNLINLIGLTTTAQQIIKPKKNSDLEPKKLFLQYPIYMTIVDEVSKSSTLEIINSCMLSEKILLAGDYRQLPPVLDFEQGSITQENINNIEINKLLDSFPLIKEIRPKVYNLEEKNKFKWYFSDENIRELINELKHPFFKFNALKLKSNNQEPKHSFFNFITFKWNSNNQKHLNFYTFLNEQHRFNEGIQKYVNVNYDGDEKLKTINQKSGSYLVNYLNNNLKINKSVLVYDTTYLNDSFCKMINENDPELAEIINRNYRYAFDQTMTLWNNKKNTESAINEYNATTIADIIENIILNNYNGQKFDLKKIGVISMTRAQNKIIRKYWDEKLKQHKDKTINHIKIDTVDNFQGREKEIIIVDFVRAKGKFENNKLLYPSSRNYEFYKSAERINVAVSRAKENLILVGAFEELQNLEFNVSSWDQKSQKIVNNSKKILAEYLDIAKRDDVYRKVDNE
ncbi:hypothetical protein EG856_03600 [Mycoplasmopsis phocirhinis]|uniref:Uncharacterized protein n=1 Tax=Mycoplasmopsis phocirhinis TaxID=142650 RepID=A0A4P6MPE8_9BACT|nr:AAA domain-containing protein [Mycoplasmopsis phocirhinis]QBF34973.1 hypothetical protein EG856_03600 [Mycoplasmopsis phocirhinis]